MVLPPSFQTPLWIALPLPSSPLSVLDRLDQSEQDNSGSKGAVALVVPLKYAGSPRYAPEASWWMNDVVPTVNSEAGSPIRVPSIRRQGLASRVNRSAIVDIEVAAAAR